MTVRVNPIVGRFQDGCCELERLITLGAHVGWQDRKWHVFQECGCSVNDGAGTLCHRSNIRADARGKSVLRSKRPDLAEYVTGLEVCLEPISVGRLLPIADELERRWNDGAQ